MRSVPSSLLAAAAVLLLAGVGATAVRSGDDVGVPTVFDGVAASEVVADRQAVDDRAARVVVPDRTGRVAAATQLAGDVLPPGVPDPIDTGGPAYTWSIEVEQGTGLDLAAVTAIAEAALYDERSWAASHQLVRVAPGEAAIRVLIGTPATVDALCARAGLNTVGRLSCWNGSTAAINLDRWNEGVAHVDDLALYRSYVINHEVGHALGFGHRGCPAFGSVAPLMQQQTKGLDGCAPNPWPFP